MSSPEPPLRRLRAEDVEAARATLSPHLAPTPLRPSFALPAAVHAWLKLECWQPTGSFKVRGALNRLAHLPAERRARGVVAASAGNHALGVAFAAQALGGGLHARLFVPETAPAAKVEKLRRFPADVVQRGTTYDDAHALAAAEAEASGAFLVHAFDDVYTAAGQGTVGAEILDALPEVAAVLVPVGGGGLVSGMAAFLKARRPGLHIVAVQPQASPALRESLRLGRPLLEFANAPTRADGLAGGIGEMVWLHRDLIDEVVEVSEEEIEEAIVALLARDQVLAEASGAVGVAALLSGRWRPRDGRPLAVVVTGANLDAAVLGALLSARR